MGRILSKRSNRMHRFEAPLSSRCGLTKLSRALSRQLDADRWRLMALLAAMFERQTDGIGMGHAARERLGDGGLEVGGAIAVEEPQQRGLQASQSSITASFSGFRSVAVSTSIEHRTGHTAWPSLPARGTNRCVVWPICVASSSARAAAAVRIRRRRPHHGIARLLAGQCRRLMRHVAPKDDNFWGIRARPFC
jgi:hypothetical protein